VGQHTGGRGEDEKIRKNYRSGKIWEQCRFL